MPRALYKAFTTILVVCLLFGSGIAFYRSELVQRFVKVPADGVEETQNPAPQPEKATATTPPLGPTLLAEAQRPSPSPAEILRDMATQLRKDREQIFFERGRLSGRSSSKTLDPEYRKIIYFLDELSQRTQDLADFVQDRLMPMTPKPTPPERRQSEMSMPPVAESKIDLTSSIAPAPSDPLLEASSSLGQPPTAHTIDWPLVVSALSLLIGATIMFFGDNLGARMFGSAKDLALTPIRPVVVEQLPPTSIDNSG